ncbi:MAG: Smr/MutS family protein [Rehaibacterium terrae]|uniref:Smr/MutS family protein n=1 Tax=Rehaibacterium terrae TaxID=1341696 RepID=UPI00391AB27E
MRRKPTRVDADDAALFRDAVGPVRRIEIAEGSAASRRKPEATPRQRESDEIQALRASRQAPFEGLDANLAEPLAYRRPEVPERVLKRLKRGLYAVQDEIDLHRMNAALAETVLREFLRESRARGRHCVRVVHGKGLHSKADGPVLKGLVDRLLSQRADVLAYASAPPAQGGTGAVLVLLARYRPGERGGRLSKADLHPSDAEAD